MRNEKIDLLLVSSYPNYYYLSGLRANVGYGVFTLAITQQGDGYWIGRRTEMPNASNLVAMAGWSEVYRPIRDEEEPYEALAQAVQQLAGNAGTVGVELEARTFSPAGIETFRRVAPDLRIVNSSGLVETEKAIKSTTELAYMRQAGTMTAMGVTAAVSRLTPGMTDSALATIVIDELLKLGSAPLAMLPAVIAGPRSALAHETFANLTIRSGELINIETSAVVAGYCAPVYRIASLGEPTDEMKRFHDASRDALAAGLQKIGPGMTFHEGDRVVREVIQARGYLDYFPVRAAYGVGINWVDDYCVSLRPNDQRLVQTGMTFHMVPALYKPGLGCVCCSTTAIVTDDGLESIVPIEQALLIV
jgi:Xaa-Pro dipeptidase